MFARYRIEMRMTGEPGFERAVEISSADDCQIVVEFDGNTASLNDGTQPAAVVHQVRIAVAIASALAGPGNRLAAQDPGGVAIEDEAAAEPLRLAPAQPQAVRHARPGEPVMARQAYLVQVIDGIGADPEK